MAVAQTPGRVGIVWAGATNPNDYYVAVSTNSATITEPATPTLNGQTISNPNSAANGSSALIMEITLLPSQAGSGQNAAFSVPAATYIGGTQGSTIPISLAGDSASDLYLAGTTTNSGFPINGTSICKQSCTGFVAKLDPTLKIIYSLTLPVASANAVAADTSGNAYINGSATAGSLAGSLAINTALQSSLTGGTALSKGSHAFLLELNSTGGLVFASNIGGSGTDVGNAVALSSTGSVAYVAGATSSADLPITPGTAAYGGAGPGGQGDAFVVALNNLPAAPSISLLCLYGWARR